MKLWLLRPIEKKDGPWEPWYDKAFGFVVRAETEADARALAQSEGGDETSGGRDPARGRVECGAWTDPANSTCVELTGEGDAEVVLRDFAAA